VITINKNPPSGNSVEADARHRPLQPPGRGILYFTILPKFYQSEQTRDLPVYIHVNVHGGGVLGQAGHRHDAAADNDHKARTGAQTHLAHIQRVTLGRTRQLGVVAEGILRFIEWYKSDKNPLR